MFDSCKPSECAHGSQGRGNGNIIIGDCSNSKARTSTNDYLDEWVDRLQFFPIINIPKCICRR